MQLSALGKGRLTFAYKVPLKTLIMQLSVLAILLIGVPARAHVFSQTVSLAMNNMPLEKVFVEIKKQTGYTFAYFESDLAKAKPVNINVSNAKLTEVLAILFENQPLTYTIVDKVIVVKTKSEKKIVVSGDALPALPIDVRGRVVNEEGEAVAGVTVAVKGTKNATATTGEGEFVLRNVDPAATLVITGVNILTIEEELRGRRDLLLHVKGKTGKLDEVQVIAYGTTSQRFNTGNTATVKASDIERQPVQNPLLALQGRVPGLVVTQNNGINGGGITVRIQGQNSIANGNDPLIVIDGIPYPSQMLNTTTGGAGPATNILGNSGALIAGNPLNYINPADIESIDILKDADATAIYGSRAANGAILITTKKGKAGQVKVDVNLQQGWSKVPKKLDLLNTQQYLEMRREAFRNENAAVGATDYDLNGAWDTTRYTDWQKVLIGGTAEYSTVDLSVYGGTNNVQYRIGGNYKRATTVFPGNSLNTSKGLFFNLAITSANQKFRLQFGGSYSTNSNLLPIVDVTAQAISFAPNAPAIYNPDGTLNWQPNASGSSTWNNPLSLLETVYENTTTNLLGNATVSYRIIPGLDIKSSFGYSQLQTNEFYSLLITAVPPEVIPFYTRQASYTNSSQKRWIVEPQINYQRNIGKGKLDLLIGATIQRNVSNGDILTGSGYSSDLVLKDRLSASTFRLNTNFTEYKYNAAFGRVSYNYDNRYLINLTIRRDGSSRFGSANRFHNFGAIGAGWIFTEERIIKTSLNWLSFGKIRGSYGTTGSDQIGDYSFLNLFTPSANTLPYQGLTGISGSTIINQYLEWEETKKLQGGIDLGFFNDRVLISGTYVKNRCSNQLMQYPLPVMTGIASISTNFPATVQNTAWEFTLNSTNIKTRKFIWKSSINLTIPKNKLVAFPNLATSSFANQLIVGKSLTVIRSYRFAGVNPITGVYQILDRFGNPTSSGTAADIVLNELPGIYYGGFQNSIGYKGFQLDFIFQFVKQTGSNYLTNNNPGRFSSGLSNQPITILRRWQKPGDITDVQRVSTTFLSGNSGDALLTDISYMRLKNLSLSYQLPDKWLKSIKLQGGSIYLHGQNLLTFTKYDGLDPETKSLTSLPPLRTITIGAKITL